MAKLAIKLKSAACKNVRVIDGDTVEGELIWGNRLRRTKIQTRIRLAGINAPEMRPQPEPYAEEAKEFLADRIEGKTITVKFAIQATTKEWIRESGGTWDNRRLLGILYQGWGKSLNVSLVQQGLAKVYPTPTWMVKWFERRLQQAQLRAQRKRRGIWQHNVIRTGGSRVAWFCLGAVVMIIILILWAS